MIVTETELREVRMWVTFGAMLTHTHHLSFENVKTPSIVFVWPTHVSGSSKYNNAETKPTPAVFLEQLYCR